MLQYGFDFDEDFQVSLSDTNNIQSQLGMPASDGATYQPMTYTIKSLLPLLTDFAYVDSSGAIHPGIFNDYAAAKSVEDTFTVSSGGGDTNYYGFRLRYFFSEAIEAVTGISGNIPTPAPPTLPTSSAPALPPSYPTPTTTPPPSPKPPPPTSTPSSSMAPSSTPPTAPPPPTPNGTSSPTSPTMVLLTSTSKSPTTPTP